jgi:membrane protein implicated in regulation of membrane protease activity
MFKELMKDFAIVFGIIFGIIGLLVLYALLPIVIDILMILGTVILLYLCIRDYRPISSL